MSGSMWFARDISEIKPGSFSATTFARRPCAHGEDSDPNFRYRHVDSYTGILKILFKCMCGHVPLIAIFFEDQASEMFKNPVEERQPSEAYRKGCGG